MRTTTLYRKRAHTAFESLESRQLLSSSLNAGILTITGTNAKDNVLITVSGSNYVVAEVGLPNKNYLFAAVGEVIADLKGDNDIFGMQSTITIPAVVKGGGGDDFIIGAAGKDTLTGGSGNDSLFGSTNNDVLNGEDGNDSLIGNAGVDGLIGGKNNDTMDGGTGNDFMDGGADNDTVTYANRITVVTAELDTDYANKPKEVTGSGGAGGGEHDTYFSVENLVGGTNKDHLGYVAKSFPANKNFTLPISIDGANGDDTLSATGPGVGGQANDFKYTIVTMKGGKGKDTLYHDHAVSTKLYGGDDDDVLSGFIDDQSTPPIIADGGSGHDIWRDGSSIGSSYTLDMSHSIEDLQATNNFNADVTIIGNEKANHIDFSGSTGTTVHIDAKGGDDQVELHDNIDGDTLFASTVLGGSGKDFIADDTSGLTNPSKDKFDGGSGDDSLHGGKGDDSLTGGSGHDKLFGEDGKDTLVGNDGEKDTLDGGSGNDKAKKDGIDNIVSVEAFI